MSHFNTIGHLYTFNAHRSHLNWMYVSGKDTKLCRAMGSPESVLETTAFLQAYCKMTNMATQGPFERSSGVEGAARGG